MYFHNIYPQICQSIKLFSVNVFKKFNVSYLLFHTKKHSKSVHVNMLYTEWMNGSEPDDNDKLLLEGNVNLINIINYI